jgi:hypothetical protein
MAIKIKTKDMELIYDFDKLESYPAELAREIGEWKLSQLEAPAGDWNMLVRSGGAEFMHKFSSYVFLPVKEGKAIDFDFDYCPEIEAALKRGLAKEVNPKMREAMQDFFLNTGNAEIGSTLLQSRLDKQNQDALLRTLLAISDEMTNLSGKEKKGRKGSSRGKSKGEPKK